MAGPFTPFRNTGRKDALDRVLAGIVALAGVAAAWLIVTAL